MVHKLTMSDDGKWASEYLSSASPDTALVDGKKPAQIDLAKAPVEVRTVTRRQLFIGDKPVGDPFE